MTGFSECRSSSLLGILMPLSRRVWTSYRQYVSRSSNYPYPNAKTHQGNANSVQFHPYLNLCSIVGGSSTKKREQVVHLGVGVNFNTQKSFATGTSSFRHCRARRRICTQVASGNILLIAMNLSISLEWLKRWRKWLASSLEAGLDQRAGRTGGER